MSTLLSNLELGFSVAFTLHNLGLCLLGCLLGTLVGVLPGLGPVATIAMLLPITFALPPVAALIMLAGIYYGAQYGGSTTAILVNIPGESRPRSSPAIDGHMMARKGRAGSALAIAALGSFFAGCVATAWSRCSRSRWRGSPAVPVARLLRPDGVRHGRSRWCWRKARSSGPSRWWCSGCFLGLVGTDLASGADALHVRHIGAGRRHRIRAAWRWACSASPR